jgi:hypothetical protein
MLYAATRRERESKVWTSHDHTYTCDDTVSYETGNITMHMEIVKMWIIYRLSTSEEERKHMTSIHFLSFLLLCKITISSPTVSHLVKSSKGNGE